MAGRRENPFSKKRVSDLPSAHSGVRVGDEVKISYKVDPPYGTGKTRIYLGVVDAIYDRDYFVILRNGERRQFSMLGAFKMQVIG